MKCSHLQNKNTIAFLYWPVITEQIFLILQCTPFKIFAMLISIDIMVLNNYYFIMGAHIFHWIHHTLHSNQFVYQIQLLFRSTSYIYIYLIYTFSTINMFPSSRTAVSKRIPSPYRLNLISLYNVLHLSTPVTLPIQVLKTCGIHSNHLSVIPIIHYYCYT